MEQINKVATVIKQICKILIENEVTYSEYKMIQIRLDDEVLRLVDNTPLKEKEQ